MMVKKIKLTNFKGYRDHEITLKSQSILVGSNNAGKSTMVEALRILALAIRKLLNVGYTRTPEWVTEPLATMCVEFQAENTGVDASNLFYGNGEGPAVIKCEFSNGASVHCFIGEGGKIAATGIDRNGKRFLSKRMANDANLPRLRILPQLAPVQRQEVLLQKSTVRAAIDSHLLSRHFRNQCYYNPKNFSDFKDKVKVTWPGVQVEDIRVDYSIEPKGIISMMVRHLDYYGELSNMGHGLQMWMQIMWFISLFSDDDVIVLDEPDVYMHPDLQRRVLKIITPISNQVVLTTHSVEIMAQVNPSRILVINRTSDSSVYCPDVDNVQRVLSNIGSIHNLAIAKMIESDRFIFVEGDDLDYLEKLWKKQYPKHNKSLKDYPNTDVGGWGGWVRVTTLTRYWRRVKQGSLKVLAIFDRDYHSNALIEERRKKAEALKIDIIVWSKKEIENYFIIAGPIVRAIKQQGREDVSMEEMEKIIKEIESDKKLTRATVEAIADIMEQDDKEYRSKSVSWKMKEARKMLDERINNGERLYDIANGKEILRKIFKEVRKKYGVSLSIPKIIDNMNRMDINGDIKALFEEIKS